MFQKRFIVVSMVNSFPAYLTLGKAPLFDNFKITGIDFYFSTTVTFAIRCESEAAAEVYIGGLLYVHPRFSPLTVIPIYDPVELVPPNDDLHSTSIPDSGPGEGITPLNPHPLPAILYHEWKAELVAVVARATGQSVRVIKINDTEAEKWYRDGFTPYQCFRETYDMENDSGL